MIAENNIELQERGHFKRICLSLILKIILEIYN